jgi:NodT family efflux transporter outer membrane factor (OMF) lipoprotein
MKRWIGVAAAAIAVVLAGCATGPAYVKPAVDVPKAFKGRDATAAPSAATPPQGWQAATPQDTHDRGDWWAVFNDSRLNELESRVSVSNETIQKAVSVLKQARASVGMARSNYFPQVGAGVFATSTHTSANINFRAAAGHTVPDYSAGVTASWEPDLFDKVGHAVDAASARAQASAADLAAVELSMHSDLAVDYFELRGVDAQAELLRRTIAGYQTALDMVQLRFNSGIASDSDVAQAQTQLQTARSQLIDLGVARAALQDAIAVLCGESASTFSLSPDAALGQPPEIPVGVPSELLERRPDVAAAERRVLASNADVGSATSAFFPDLMLAASGGLESSNLGSWLSLPSRYWAIGPALIGTLFDGGFRKQQLKGAQASYEGAVADYRQVVLASFQEVEDNLAALRVLADEAATQQLAVSSAERSLDLTMTRYKGGAVGYLDVVTAQTIALTNESTATQIAQRRLAASVLLVKALGGLWTTEGGNPAG